MSVKEMVSIEDGERRSQKTDTEAVNDGLGPATTAPPLVRIARQQRGDVCRTSDAA